MVSAIWSASSRGDFDLVQELLKDASLSDVEIKDQNGVTPLIEAIKNGHVEVVRILLDKGANPTNASSQALPEQYTSDPAIVKLLNVAKASAHFHDLSDPERRYDVSHPGAYAYYPSMNPSAPPVHEATMYFPSPPLPAGEHQVPGGPPNLPPPEVARLIPCRFYPACRYGSSCLFAHPQGPYFAGPLPPPAQYPAPYEPIMGPNYYSVPPPPPSFQPPPNNIHPHMSPTSPPSGVHPTPLPMVHARSGSEIMSPQAHFSPSGAPPYGPMSPSFPHPGQVPLSIPPPPPPPHHQPPPQSPQSLYHNTSPPPPFAVRPDPTAQYPPQTVNTNPPYTELNGVPKSPPNAQSDGYVAGPGPVYRENTGHNRRGSVRRGSFAGRKPACLFYPSGRCKNGDDCRFPHIIPESSGGHPPSQFSGRGGLRSRGNHANGNGFSTIEEKLAGMTVKDDPHPRTSNGSSRSHSTEPGSRGRFSHGPKANHSSNLTRADKKAAVKQRVPNADDFPVLAGSTTPPARSPGHSSLVNGNGHLGPTAAQILQTPARIRNDSGKESGTRGGTPELVVPAQSALDYRPVELNGVSSDVSDSPPHKHPCAAAPDVAKEVSVSA